MAQPWRSPPAATTLAPERAANLDEFVELTGYHRKHAIRVFTALHAFVSVLWDVELPVESFEQRLDALMPVWWRL